MTTLTPLKAVVFHSALGWMGVAYSPNGVVASLLPRASEGAARRAIWEEFPSAQFAPAEDAPDDIVAQLQRYAAGEPVTFQVTLDWSGHTDFRRRVWRVTQSIPYGETRSYGWIARAIGKPAAARAVGQAMGANPTPIIVPCHRVVASDGGLGGFGAGLDMKRRLLALERDAIKGGR